MNLEVEVESVRTVEMKMLFGQARAIYLAACI